MNRRPRIFNLSKDSCAALPGGIAWRSFHKARSVRDRKNRACWISRKAVSRNTYRMQQHNSHNNNNGEWAQGDREIFRRESRRCINFRPLSRSASTHPRTHSSSPINEHRCLRRRRRWREIEAPAAVSMRLLSPVSSAALYLPELTRLVHPWLPYGPASSPTAPLPRSIASDDFQNTESIDELFLPFGPRVLLLAAGRVPSFSLWTRVTPLWCLSHADGACRPLFLATTVNYYITASLNYRAFNPPFGPLQLTSLRFAHYPLLALQAHCPC